MTRPNPYPNSIVGRIARGEWVEAPAEVKWQEPVQLPAQTAAQGRKAAAKPRPKRKRSAGHYKTVMGRGTPRR